MSPSKLTSEVWPVTSTGQPGTENEDAVLLYQPTDPTEVTYAGSLFAVASSRGTGERGHVACQYAVRKVMDSYYRSGEPDLGLRLRDAVEAANADLFAHSQAQPELVKVAVSLTTVAIRGEQLHTASVGDNRAYLIRENHILRITTDHTLVQQLVEEGAVSEDEVRDHPRRDVLLRTLGTQPAVAVDVYDIRLHPDDALILCTSGMVRSLDDANIAGVVASKSPQNAADMLVQSARAAGSKDNITVIAALLRDGAPPIIVDVPYTWDRRPPSFEEQPTLAMPRTDRPTDQAGQTMVNPRIDRDAAAAQTQVSPTGIDRSAPGMQTRVSPGSIDRSAPGMQTQVSARSAQPPDDSWSQQGQAVPAPPYQASVQPAPQPAPPYQPAPPPYQPPPPPPAYQPPAGQPAYPPQPQYAQPPYQPPPPNYPPPPLAQPYAPPGYAIDPVTGLPPVPQTQQGWGTPQGGGYQPRVYQAPAQPNYRAPRRGLSIGTFALVGAMAVLLTGAMVVVLINPFGWELPFSLVAEAPTPTPTAAPSLPPTTPPPQPTIPVPTPAASPNPVSQAAPPGMALIAGGAFQRGVNNQEAAAAQLLCVNETVKHEPTCNPENFLDAQPVEMVTISPYFMDFTEVTNRAYAGCVAANACTPPKTIQFYNDPAYADHPVVFVTWGQAGTYCQWAGKRLPTEAEWEKAARWDQVAQQANIWPWGSTFETGVANILSSGQKGTRPVGSFPKDKSAWGMLDMVGNVTEWVQDWYFKGYNNLGTLNPTGPASQPLGDAVRVARGGSFLEIASYSRPGHRLGVKLDTSVDWLGFRCAQPVQGAVQPTQAPSPTGATGTPGAPPAGVTPTAGGPTSTKTP